MKRPVVNEALLREGLCALGIEASAAQIDMLCRYIAEIELWNAAYGLVNDSGDGLITRHILDSLAPLPHILPLAPRRVADAGSGAGLPGIPLSIMMPNASFSLIERMGKRCSFLANQKALLPLPNVDIQEKDIGSASGPFDLVAFRAFRPLEPPIVDQLLALISPSGRLAAWKGKRKNIEAELASIERYGLSAHIIETPVPGLDEERHLVLLSR